VTKTIGLEAFSGQLIQHGRHPSDQATLQDPEIATGPITPQSYVRLIRGQATVSVCDSNDVVMAMVRERRVSRIGGRDMRAQTTFVAALMDIAA
jgi:hypothetical protein